MKIRTVLSNLVIILSLCFLTFAVLDWYNPMMNFSGNVISSKLLLVLCVSAIALADRKSTRLNSSHSRASRMPSSA